MRRLSTFLLSLTVCLLASTSAWADMQVKTIVKANFSDWAAYQACADKSTATDTTGTITAKYSSEAITFALHNTNVYEGGSGKVAQICAAPAKYLCGMKQTTDIATITTSAISSVATVTFTERATGSSRGWGLKVKGDGDADWVTLYETTCGSENVTVPVEVNRTNVQLQWYNLSAGNYAALTDLEITGSVDIAPRTFTDL